MVNHKQRKYKWSSRNRRQAITRADRSSTHHGREDMKSFRTLVRSWGAGDGVHTARRGGLGRGHGSGERDGGEVNIYIYIYI